MCTKMTLRCLIFPDGNIALKLRVRVRILLITVVLLSSGLPGVLSDENSGKDDSLKHSSVSLHHWQRDGRNPIFVPRDDFDRRGSQAPFVISHGGLWWMFYAGIGDDYIQRICLATAVPDDPTNWQRHGPVLPLGMKGSFDELSATYPRVHRIKGRWHLYYSGRSNQEGPQHFSNYRGIGLAISDDLKQWTKYSADPVLEGDGIREYPENRALVGLGNITELPQSDGRVRYRMYYTLLPGLRDPDWEKNGTWHIIEHKLCAAAESDDGISWTDRKIVMDRRRNVPSEDIAVVGLNVWRKATGYHGLYTGLGTDNGSYSLAEAVSQDGLHWSRGSKDGGKDVDNVSLRPAASGWESGMIGYPHLLIEDDQIRIFYNGTSGGASGIGMATAEQDPSM